MTKETNIEKIKDVAILFLHLDIKETQFPWLIQHPFWNTPFLPYEGQMVNILEEPQIYQKIIKNKEEKIQTLKDVSSILLCIDKPYRLTFLKFIREYMSIKDFSHFLGEIWISSEDPNQDVNVSTAMASRWFKKADKRYLMNDKEYQIYYNLPETLKVYRGVSVGRNPNGLSWTDDYSKAVWFAHRFDSKNQKGYVRDGEIKKKDILAYFSRRGEKEIVIDPKCLIAHSESDSRLSIKQNTKK